jgi:polysaccharide biosynthesis transport protein
VSTVNAVPGFDAAPPRPKDEKHLRDYWFVILRRRRVVTAVFLAVVAAFAVRAFVTTPVYQATVQLLIDPGDPNVVSFKDVNEVVNARDDYYQTQYKLLQSRALARKVLEGLNLLALPQFGGPRTPQEIELLKASPPGENAAVELAIDQFLLKVKVNAVKNSRLVGVSVEFPKPELAAQIANKLAELYIGQTLEFRYQTSAEAGQWLGGQADEQKKKLSAAQAALEQLKERDGLVNIEERRTLLEQRLKDLGATLDSLHAQTLQKRALYDQMRSTRNPEDLPGVMSSPFVQSMNIELASLQRDEQMLLQKYMEQHPEVLRVRNQIADTKRKIRDQAGQVISAAENDYKASAAQESSVSGALEAAKAEALDLSRRAVQYDTMKREVDSQQQVLDTIITRHNQTDVTQDLKASNIRIVDPASVPAVPIRPKRVEDILIGIILGAGLSVGLAFFLDYLDSTLKTPDDVRVHLAAPLLAVIAETENNDQQAGGRVLLTGQAQGPFIEGYRLLRTSINYSFTEQAPRTLLVTSTAPGEGKTLTSINLALTLAAMDGNVLLIDCDLRKPQGHVVLKAKRGPGLADVLTGKSNTQDATQKIPGTTLSFMGSGTNAPSPSDLLTVASLKRVLEGLRGQYTWVIVDSPPLAAVSDALILAPLTDGVVVVAGAEMVPRKAVRHSLERIGESGARLLGIVLNRAQVERHSY